MNRKKFIFWNIAGFVGGWAFGAFAGVYSYQTNRPLMTLDGEPTLYFKFIVVVGVLIHALFTCWLVKRRSQNAGRPKIFELYLILVGVGLVGSWFLGLPFIGGLTGVGNLIIIIYLCFVRPATTTTVTYPGEPDVTFKNELIPR